MFVMQRHFDTEQFAAPVVLADEASQQHLNRLSPVQWVDDRPQTSTLRVLAATFSKVRHDKDFGRVEACVTVTFQYHPSLPPRTERLLTSVPVKPVGHDNNLRQRLVESAVNLSVLMHRTERGERLRKI